MMNIIHTHYRMKSRIQSLLLVVLTVLMPAKMLAQEPYAVLSDGNTVLTFYYDDQKDARGGLSVGPFSYPDYQPWYSERETITTVVFDASFADCTSLTNTTFLFKDCKSITSIENIANFKTDNVTGMYGMFEGCSSLTNLDLSTFSTDNVTDMVRMFYGCAGLTNLDLSHFNTSKVTRMDMMFNRCSGLTSIDLSSFNTSNVTGMSDMFYGCSSLTSLDLSNFNTENVTNMEMMFYECSSLTSLDLSNFNTANVTDMGSMFALSSSITSLNLTSFNTEKVTSMSSMFMDCSGLTSLDLSSFNTANVTNMYQMFTGCSSLTSLDVSNFNTANVTNMTNMFHRCSNLTSLDVSGFNTVNVTQMSQMFASCAGLTTLDLSHFNTSNVTDMGWMFEECTGLKDLDISGFNTTNVTYMRSMFTRCPALKTIYVGNDWSTASVTESANMFRGCYVLVGGAGTHFDANNTDHTYAHIDGGTANPGYFTESGAEPWVDSEPYAALSDDNTVLTFYYDDQKDARGGMDINNMYVSSSPYGTATTAIFDTSFADYEPTSTAYWFEGCSSLTSIIGIENLKTDNVTDMHRMFTGCYSLRSLDVSGFNTENVTDMTSMFYNCSAITSLDLSSFNTQNVTDMWGMFEGCYSLTSLDLSGFNTQNVTDMKHMFAGCSGLTSLNLSGFNTLNVTDMDNMFYDCSGLTSLDVSGFNTENVTSMNYMFNKCSNLTSLDLSTFNTANVTDMYGMLGDCSSLTTFDVSGFNIANVTDMRYMFSGCSSLAAIKAGSANIPAEQYAEIGNPNLLVYVNDASVAPQGIQNVVINGVAQEITLSDESNWYCPQPFTAEKISYTRTFSQETQISVSRGWETIALPFNVQTITHATKGVISPFGNNSGNYHFWLRRLTSNGLQSMQQIEANTAYLISMPNSSEYSEEYNLAGEVTFSAENADVPETSPVHDEYGNYVMTPVFERWEAQQYVYALNVGEARGGYPEGSVFEQNYRELRPFEAFTKHLTDGGSRFLSLEDLNNGNVTGLQEIDGVRGKKDDVYYDLQGRRVLHPSKGVYIQNGNKVIVK